jgi:hypothetical protein
MELTRPTRVLFFVELSVVIFLPFLDVLSNVILGDFAGTCGASFVVDPETNQCHYGSECGIAQRDVLVGHMFKDPVDHIATKSTLIRMRTLLEKSLSKRFELWGGWSPLRSA